MTIVVIEHHMDFLLELAETVTVLDHGQVIFDGDSQAVRQDQRVLTAYLGSATNRTEV